MLVFLIALRTFTYDFFTDRSGLPHAPSAMLGFGVGQFVAFAAFGNAAYVASSILQVMALIVLAAICFLACVFLLFALVQWTRDTTRRSTVRPAVNSEESQAREEKRTHVVGSRRAPKRRHRSKVGAHRVCAITERPEIREPWRNERERIAYQRIARSFKPGKRS